MFYQYSGYSIYLHEKRAATDIQRHWRGFWDYSHFVIQRYEACKIQAVVRGYQLRKRMDLEHVAASIIQAAARSLLAKKLCHMERLFATMVYSAQIALCQKIAARKIQTAFRIHYQEGKEKAAALVIERFFIWVRTEVEREIERREKAKLRKKRRERTKRMEEDELLDNVYNDNARGSNVLLRAPSGSAKAPRPGGGTLKEHLRESMSATGSHNRRSYGYARQAPKSSQLNVNVEEDASSDVSGLTTPTVTSPQFKYGRGRGGKAAFNDEIDDELEGAWNEAAKKNTGYAGRPRTRESQKENSSSGTPTPNFKVSARSLSRNRRELHRARVS